MQCKDIPDTPILAFLDGPFDDWPVAGWGTWYWFDDFKPKNSVLHAMPTGTPAKLALAKMRGLIARKLIDGCGCGCRGDFELSSKGRQWLAHERSKTYSA